MRSGKNRILVVGHVPPPFHGQAISTQRFLAGKYDNAELFLVRLSLSSEMGEVGRFKLGKVTKIFATVAQVIFSKFKHRCSILYYMPSGGQRISLYRDFILLLSTRWLFKKTIFHFRSSGLSELYERLNFLERWLFHLSYSKPDVTIRLSSLNPDDGSPMKTKRDIIIPNGIEDFFQEYGFTRSDKEKTSILYIGTIRESKGVWELLEAVRQLHNQGLDFKLILAGTFHGADFEAKVRARVKESDYISFVGEVTGDEKWKLFGKVDMLAFPSYYENESFGLVLIEAMQFQLPIVAADWRAIPGIVENERTGFIVPIKNVDLLANKMKLLLEDPALRESMGTTARQEYLNKYSVQRFYQNFDQLFKEI